MSGDADTHTHSEMFTCTNTHILALKKVRDSHLGVALDLGRIIVATTSKRRLQNNTTIIGYNFATTIRDRLLAVKIWVPPFLNPLSKKPNDLFATYGFQVVQLR